MDAAPAPPEPGPVERPGWNPWHAVAAIVIGLVATLILALPVIGLFAAGGADVSEEPPALVLTLTLLQDACWVFAVLWFASKVAPPHLRQFGFRGTRFWPAVGWATLAFVISIVGALLYVAAFDVEIEQTTLEELGAGQGALLTLVIGVLVVGIAPVVEEFVFRGYLYGALRTRFAFLPAALIDGVIFGGIHATTGPSAVPPLIILGFAFCLVYEATGSILPTICLHALNNMVAFGSDKDGSWAVGAVVAAIVVASAFALASSQRRLVA